MSGFEIAGTVLAVLPLLITALEDYGEGIRTIKSMVGYKALVSDLVLDFKIETFHFRRGCEKLLSRLEVPPEQVDQLLKHPNGTRWNDPILDVKIKNLLGLDYSNYKLLVARLFARLDKFSKRLGLKDDFTPKWMSRNQVVKPRVRDKFFQKTTGTWKAIMLGFDRDEHNAAIVEIRSDIAAIGSVVGDAIELEAPRRERNQSANTKFWSSIRQYAASLFESIRWKCPCASNHTVNLRLQARKKTEEEADASYLFIMLFAYSGNPAFSISPPWIWRQARVQPSELPDTHVAGSVSFANPALTPPPPGPAIGSLCQALKNAPRSPSCIGFLDYDQCRHHLFASSQEETRIVMSLEQVLTQTHNCQYTYGIKERYKLSVTLASTVLQLCTTPWLHTVWSKNDIYFIKGGEASLTDQLYVRKSGGAAQGALPPILPTGVRPWSNPSLLALAVVLVELYFKRPLESIPALPHELDPAGNPWPQGLTEEMKVTRLISGIDPGTREKEAPYFRAVERCLRCNFDTPSLDLRNSRFQEVFYLDVIAPLEKSYESIL